MDPGATLIDAIEIWSVCLFLQKEATLMAESKDIKVDFWAPFILTSVELRRGKRLSELSIRTPETNEDRTVSEYYTIVVIRITEIIGDILLCKHKPPKQSRMI